ncbi:hypothetical protein SDC9_183330 [bioreactor metagenome]|uniref:Uncharacterized protein n=1 Tax=bioreactor metagenome TaxID=1076179 RepID=A0A645H9Z4_9ZZZZ
MVVRPECVARVSRTQGVVNCFAVGGDLHPPVGGHSDLHDAGLWRLEFVGKQKFLFFPDRLRQDTGAVPEHRRRSLSIGIFQSPIRGKQRQRQYIRHFCKRNRADIKDSAFRITPDHHAGQRVSLHGKAFLFRRENLIVALIGGLDGKLLVDSRLKRFPRRRHLARSGGHFSRLRPPVAET